MVILATLWRIMEDNDVLPWNKKQTNKQKSQNNKQRKKNHHYYNVTKNSPQMDSEPDLE